MKLFSTSCSFLKPGWVLALVILISSCAKQKDFVYFQANPSQDSTQMLAALESKNYIPILHTDDIISIQISAVDPEVVKPFNMGQSSFSSSALNSNNPNNSGSSGSSSASGYLIDANGMIDFPVLGSLKMAGLNRMEATEMIKARLKTYVNNPIVNIRILNYKVTVLGEVKNPGVYSIPHERITLPEALGLAGDLTIAGVRKNILVIRDDNGKKTETRIDLTSKDVFNSPVYYLNQNDLVYVEPSKARIQSSTPTVQFGSLIVTSASLIINVLTLLAR